VNPGHGPGERRGYGRRRGTVSRSGGGSSARPDFGGPRASRLGSDEIDALLSVVDRVRFVAFDFETTGLSADRDRVVEIGAVAFRVRKEDGRWIGVDDGAYETLVNPERPIPPAVSAIHGIDDLAVSSAPTFAETAAELLAFIDGSILVAHNAPFDMGFLAAEAARATSSSRGVKSPRVNRSDSESAGLGSRPLGPGSDRGSTAASARRAAPHAPGMNATQG